MSSAAMDLHGKDTLSRRKILTTCIIQLRQMTKNAAIYFNFLRTIHRAMG